MKAIYYMTFYTTMDKLGLYEGKESIHAEGGVFQAEVQHRRRDAPPPRLLGGGAGNGLLPGGRHPNQDGALPEGLPGVSLRQKPVQRDGGTSVPQGALAYA